MEARLQQGSSSVFLSQTEELMVSSSQAGAEMLKRKQEGASSSWSMRRRKAFSCDDESATGVGGSEKEREKLREGKAERRTVWRQLPGDVHVQVVRLRRASRRFR